MKYFFKFLLYIFCFLFITSTTSAQELERIINFKSVIEIQKDSSIIVDEYITVKAAGIDIKRGIYRDIPTTYRNNSFLAVKKPITVLSVTKNEVTEPYRIEQTGNNTRIYIGDENVFLDSGEYRYHIRYSTVKQLGYFENYDELYWNVTGNDWSFPIDFASVEISLPEGVQPDSVNVIGYVGPKGSTNTDVGGVNPRLDNGRTRVGVSAKNLLSKGEGLTVAVNWPKGYVTEPSKNENLLALLLDNITSVGSIILLVLAAIYYYLVWHGVGKDRKVPSVTVVQYGPPQGMTPAQVRYIDKMGHFDNQCIAANIVHMAVQGYVTIHEQKTYHFVRRTSKPHTDLPHEEKIIYESMFPTVADVKLEPSAEDSLNELKSVKIKLSGQINNPLIKAVAGPIANKLEDAVKKFAVEQDTKDQFTFKYANNYRVRKMVTRVDEYFKEIGKRMFVGNAKYLWFGITLLIVLVAAHVIDMVVHKASENIFFVFFTTFWNGVSSIFVLTGAAQLFSGIKNKRKKDIMGGLVLTVFMIPFIGVGGFTAFMAFGLFGSISFLGIVIILAISYYSLKRRTDDARVIQNHIDGFKLFLTKAQQRYIEKIQKTLPEKFSMYESFLPYAIALDVEPQWSAQFKETIELMNKSGMETSPSWYRGTHLAGTAGAFSASSFASSFSSSIASASVNPSSSSGSSGGGSSGGGGGGGGGGGW